MTTLASLKDKTTVFLRDVLLMSDFWLKKGDDIK